jgi:hypothetical protein
VFSFRMAYVMREEENILKQFSGELEYLVESTIKCLIVHKALEGVGREGWLTLNRVDRIHRFWNKEENKFSDPVIEDLSIDFNDLSIAEIEKYARELLADRP